MFKPIVANNIKYITTLLFVLFFAPLLFAEEVDTNKTGNHGYIVSNDVPEVKKGTVVIRPDNPSLSTPAPAPAFEPAAPKPSFRQALQEKNFSELQNLARRYREQGLEYQRVGNLDAALAFYQKAIEFDPSYAVAYNDLGIIYEANGFLARAEESYLQAIKLDPNLLGPYANLALLYENERNLDKAVFYWSKRVQLGLPNDPWTEKARRRLEDIRSVTAPVGVIVEDTKGKDITKEREIADLINDVSSKKAKADNKNKDVSKEEAVEKIDKPKKKKGAGERVTYKKGDKEIVLKECDDLEFAKTHFQAAKANYEKGDYVTALKEAIDAQQRDPNNPEIEKFVEDVGTKVLTR